jgi:hypothetical protein
VNSFLWLVWGVVWAAASGPWFPWPLFPLGGWAIGLVFHAWNGTAASRSARPQSSARSLGSELAEAVAGVLSLEDAVRRLSL